MYTSTLSKTLVFAAVCFLGVNSAPTLEARDSKPLIPFQASGVQSSAHTHQTRGPGVDRKVKFEAALSACGATPTGGSSNGGNVAQTSVAGGPVATSSSLARSRRSIKKAREPEPANERREAETVKERREPQPEPAAEFEIMAREWSEGQLTPGSTACQWILKMSSTKTDTGRTTKQSPASNGMPNSQQPPPSGVGNGPVPTTSPLARAKKDQEPPRR